MIVDRPGSHFIFVLPFDHVHRGYNYINLNGVPLTNKEYLENWGKWLVFGQREEMEELARKLDPFVEDRKVPGVKYDRKLITEFQLNRCVMCVYCHTERREDVWTVLSSLGVKDKAWMFERETLDKWLPGGVNLEKWIQGRNMDPEQAERVRIGAKEKFRQMFENEEAIFTGIDQ
ncbi:MAG: hypothetical protein NTY41_07335 [Proteobacteria bacterium]|nr:hypothetical protein [Pseudomonadota bacterium]